MIRQRLFSLLVALASSLSSTTPLRAGDANGAYIADGRTGCKAWNPHPQQGEQVAWTGSCADGFADGSGTLTWSKDGVTIETDEGTWKKGRQTGRATQIWNGGRYEGQIADGLPSGKGVLSMGERRYDGEFNDGRPHGPGTLTVGSVTYQGVWKEGCFNDGKRKVSFTVPLVTCQ